MNMLQENYKKELQRQIDNCSVELRALINDYHNCSDNICKSQIKTLMEKKEHNLLNLLERGV